MYAMDSSIIMSISSVDSDPDPSIAAVVVKEEAHSSSDDNNINGNINIEIDYLDIHAIPIDQEHSTHNNTTDDDADISHRRRRHPSDSRNSTIEIGNQPRLDSHKEQNIGHSFLDSIPLAPVEENASLAVKQELITDAPTVTDVVSVPPQRQALKALYRCKYCQQLLKRKDTLKKHEEAHRNGTIYKCRFCKYHSVSRTFMEGHETKHTGAKPFKCDYCDHRTRYKVDIIKHQRVHFEVREFKCHLCPFRSKWKAGIDKHLPTHSDVRNYSCHLCSSRFKRKSGLKTHMTRHSADKPFKCDQCDYACRIRSMLLMHLRTHSDVRNFICTYPGCSQKCKTKSDLKKHSFTHAETCEYACPHCGKHFKTQHALTCHVRRHTEKHMDFTCSVCFKKLSTRFGLRKHLLQHYVEKRHACPICDHRFHGLTNMKTHMKVHDSDRPIGCPICKFNAKDTNALFAHIGHEHREDYTYFCELCRKPFSTVQRLKFHIQRCHGGNQLQDDECEFVYDINCLKIPNLPRDNNVSCNNSHTKKLKIDLPSIDNVALESHNKDAVISEDNDMMDSIKETMIHNDRNSQTSSQIEDEATNSTFGTEQIHQNTSSSESTYLNPNKSPVVKLERLSFDGDAETEKLLGGQSLIGHCSEGSNPVAIRIGSITNIGVFMARKDSGFPFNGKKAKKWLMQGKGISSSIRIMNERSKGKKERNKRKPNGKLSSSNKKQNVMCREKSESSRRKGSIVKGSKRKTKGRQTRFVKNSVKKPVIKSDGVQKLTDNAHPPLVNFDVWVKCERFNPEDLFDETTGFYKLPNLHSNSSEIYQTSNTFRIMTTKDNSLPVPNTDLAVKCNNNNRLTPNEIIAEGSNTAGIQGKKEIESNDLRLILQSIKSNSHRGMAHTNDSSSLITNLSNKSRVIRAKDGASRNKSTEEASRSAMNKEKLLSKEKNRESTPSVEGTQSKGKFLNQIKTISSPDGNQREKQLVIKKRKKLLTKPTRKNKTEKSLVEKSCFVENIMDSPIKITWKTMSDAKKETVLSCSSYQKGHEKSSSATVDNIEDMGLQCKVEKQPALLKLKSTLGDAYCDGTDRAANCSVQVEDVAHICKRAGSEVFLEQSFNVNDLNNLNKNSYFQPSSQDKTGPLSACHTITLDEFEDEYRKKNKLIAKVDVVNISQPHESSSKFPFLPIETSFSSKADTDTEINYLSNSVVIQESQIQSCSAGADVKLSCNKKAGSSKVTIVRNQKNSIKKKSDNSDRCHSKNKRNTCTGSSKLKPKGKNPRKDKVKISLSLFRDCFAKKGNKCVLKNKSDKSKSDSRHNNICPLGNDEIVYLWKMAFECLANKVTIKLFDYKSQLPLGLEKFIAGTGTDLFKQEPSTPDEFQSLNETFPTHGESYEHPKTNELNEELKTLPPGSQQSQQDFISHSEVQLLYQSSDITDLSEKTREDFSTDNNPAFDSSKDVSLDCVNNATPGHTSPGHTSDSSPFLNGDNLNNWTPIPEGEESKRSAETSNAFYCSSTRAENDTACDVNTPANVDCPNSDENLNSDFFKCHAKNLQKLFPTHVTSKRLETHLIKHRSLPLPSGFFMNQNGFICRTQFSDPITKPAAAMQIGDTIVEIGNSRNTEATARIGRVNLLTDQELCLERSSEPKTKGIKGGNTAGKRSILSLDNNKNDEPQRKASDSSLQPMSAYGYQNKDHSQFSSPSLKGAGEVSPIHGHIKNQSIEVVYEVENALIASTDNEYKTELYGKNSSSLQKTDTVLYKTSDPVLCPSKGENEILDYLDSDSDTFHDAIDEDHIEVQSSHSPFRSDSLSQLSAFPDIYVDRDQSSDFGDDIAVQTTSILVESEVLPLSDGIDDLSLLPDAEFFSELTPKDNIL